MRIHVLSRFIAVVGLVLVGATTVPSSAHAQPALSGPRIASAGVNNVAAVAVGDLITPHTAASPGASAMQDRFSSRKSDIAMMVVGGAAIVVGGVVGGDGGTIIGVSGAVIGLIGLFRYLQ